MRNILKTMITTNQQLLFLSLESLNGKLTINSILTITLLSKAPVQPLTSTLGFPICKGKQWQPRLNIWLCVILPSIHCFMFFRSEEHSPPPAGKTTMSLGRNRDTIGFRHGRTYQSISTKLWKVVTSKNWRWVDSCWLLNIWKHLQTWYQHLLQYHHKF